MVWTCNAKIKYRKDKGDNQLEPNIGRRPRGRLKKRWEECIQDRKDRKGMNRFCISRKGSVQKTVKRKKKKIYVNFLYSIRTFIYIYFITYNNFVHNMTGRRILLYAIFSVIWEIAYIVFSNTL